MAAQGRRGRDRNSTRLSSSHVSISDGVVHLLQLMSPLFPYATLFRSCRCASREPPRSCAGCGPLPRRPWAAIRSMSTPPTPRPHPTAQPPARRRRCAHRPDGRPGSPGERSEQHTSELQSRFDLGWRRPPPPADVTTLSLRDALPILSLRIPGTAEVMRRLRAAPPATLGGHPVDEHTDYAAPPPDSTAAGAA